MPELPELDNLKQLAIEQLVALIVEQEKVIALLSQEVKHLKNFSSITNKDYSKLQELLEAGKWEEANNKTLAIMLRTTNQEQEGWLSIENIQQFPNSELNTINKLWLNYSNGRFGFSVQKNIWNQISKSTTSFFHRVGWIESISTGNKGQGTVQLKASFDITAPRGHLPRVILTNYLKRTHQFDFYFKWGNMRGSTPERAYNLILDKCKNCQEDLEYIFSHQYLE